MSQQEQENAMYMVLENNNNSSRTNREDAREKAVLDTLRASHPLFAASCVDGLVVASLQPNTMRHSRIKPLLGSLVVGGIGDFEQVQDLCEMHVRHYTALGRVELSPEEIHVGNIADSFAHILGAHKTAKFLKGVFEVMLLAAEVRDKPCDGTPDDEINRDQIVVVRWDARTFTATRLKILPNFSLGADSPMPWFGKNPYKAAWKMKDAIVDFIRMGEVWQKRAVNIAMEHRDPKILQWKILKLFRDPALRYDQYKGYERIEMKFALPAPTKKGGGA